MGQRAVRKAISHRQESVITPRPRIFKTRPITRLHGFAFLQQRDPGIEITTIANQHSAGLFQQAITIIFGGDQAVDRTHCAQQVGQPLRSDIRGFQPATAYCQLESIRQMVNNRAKIAQHHDIERCSTQQKETQISPEMPQVADTSLVVVVLSNAGGLALHQCSIKSTIGGKIPRQRIHFLRRCLPDIDYCGCQTAEPAHE